MSNRRLFPGEWIRIRWDIDRFKAGDKYQIIGNRINVYHYTLVGVRGIFAHSWIMKNAEILEESQVFDG